MNTALERRSGGGTSADWFADVSPAGREEIRGLHRAAPGYGWIVVGVAAAWLAIVALSLAEPLGAWRWPVAIGAGVLVHAMAVFMHEAVHGTLLRSPRWQPAAGFLLSAPLFLSCSAYRAVHLRHHRHLGTDLDPDSTFSSSRPRWLDIFVFYTMPLIGAPLYLLHVALTAFARGSPRERLQCAIEYAAIAIATFVTVIWANRTGRGAALRDLWLGMMIGAGVLNGIRAWTEHAMTDYGSPLTASRTIVSNRVWAAVLVHINYHLEHHLFPKVPWYRLPRLHDVLAEMEAKRGACVERSYLRCMWAAIRHGAAQVPPPAAIR